jgi:hypothetical protein
MKMPWSIAILFIFTACSTPHPIDPHKTEEALLAHKADFRNCKNREALTRDGYLRANFAIGKNGRVSTGSIEKSTFKTPAVGECILNVIKGIQFPLPAKAPVIIDYPFRFK